MNNYSSFLGSNCSSVTSSKVWPEHPEQRAPCLLPVAQHSSSRWEWRGVTLGTLGGGMLSHLQTTKRSANWWSQESQRSFLMHSTRQPPMHPTLFSCPHWDPAHPPELCNLGCKTQTCSLAAAALAASALCHSGPLVGFLVLHLCLLSKSHSDLVLLKVWSAECPQDDHNGECWKCKFPTPAPDLLHCTLNGPWGNALNGHLP